MRECRHQERPESSPRTPREPQERPTARSRQRRHRSVQEHHKSSPRASQEHPKSTQKRPKTRAKSASNPSQERPKSTPERPRPPKSAPRAPKSAKTKTCKNVNITLSWFWKSRGAAKSTRNRPKTILASKLFSKCASDALQNAQSRLLEPSRAALRPPKAET